MSIEARSDESVSEGVDDFIMNGLEEGKCKLSYNNERESERQEKLVCCCCCASRLSTLQATAAVMLVRHPLVAAYVLLFVCVTYLFG